MFNGDESALLEIVSLNTAAGLIVLDKYQNLNDALLFAKKHIKSKVSHYLNLIKMNILEKIINDKKEVKLDKIKIQSIN